MFDTQFIGLNVRFAVYLMAALVALAVFWLIFDAWIANRSRREALKWLGFLLVSLGFVADAATAEAATTLASAIGYIAGALRLAGYAAIIVGQLLDPLQLRPDTTGDADLQALTHPEPDQTPAAPAAPSPALAPKLKRKRKNHAIFASSLIAPTLGLLLGAGAAAITVLYWRRATTGLERHLKPVAWAFGFLSLAELLRAGSVFSASRSPILSQFASPYGPLWWLSLAALAISALILGRWVWYYLTKRLVSELFMILLTQALVLFFIATTGFTFMLMKNIRAASLADLTTASNMLQYSISSRQAETIAQAKAAAANSAAISAVAARNRDALTQALADTYKQEAFSSLTVTDSTGVVLLRAGDPTRWGDSISSDPLVRRAIIGQTASNVVSTPGVVAPTVTLTATSPMRDASGRVIGTLTVGRDISNAFVDNIHTTTGLDSTVYGGDTRAATTLTIPGTADRAIGITETTPEVTDTVLKRNHSFSGTLTMQNRSYLAALTPLRDVNNQPVGMLQVAHPTDAL
ncbi:MAG TPA: cache domain-containing protein, partial [Candidatus Saccharimonadia bacterium]|nr:cache domain-containing protein [Candidatus Saccharimonadia bacterium]